MTSCIKRFVEIDTIIKGAIKFGDGSVVDIHGSGEFLRKCFTGIFLLYYDVKEQHN